MDVSDAYRIHVCELCGLIAVANLTKNTFECRACRSAASRSRVVQVALPYACKLLFQELLSMVRHLRSLSFQRAPLTPFRT